MNQAVVEIKNCQFGYQPNKNVLNIKELSITRGEKVFLFGPSGFGKSTLLNLISGVIKSNSGELSVLGQNISGLSQSRRDRLRGEKIGYIFQIFNLIPYLSVLDNILLPTIINNERSHPDIDKQAKALISTLGLSECMHKNVTELSIGQQQRVACARALIGNPEIIIADEPTSSLDEKNTHEFMELLMKEWEEKNFTLIFVSHDERLKKYFSRTISLPEINHV
jgi:putative ABC transport system ATP-binding protein